MPRGRLTSAFPRSAILAANRQVALFLSRPVPTKQPLSQPAPRQQRAHPGPVPALGHWGRREQTTLKAAEPCTGPAFALPQPPSGGRGCRRLRGDGTAGRRGRSPAAQRGRCGAAAGRAGPAHPLAGGGRPLLAASGSAAARTVGRPLAARGGGGLRRASFLLAAVSVRGCLSQLQKASIEV